MLINKKTISELDRIIESNTLAFNSLKSNFERSFNILNYSTNPQAILDELGKDATLLFQASGNTIAFLKSIDPSYVPPPTRGTYEFNKDGTVTWTKPEPIINVTPEKTNDTTKTN